MTQLEAPFIGNQRFRRESSSCWKSQILSVPSSDPVRSLRPSALKETASTLSECPDRERTRSASVPVAVRGYMGDCHIPRVDLQTQGFSLASNGASYYSARHCSLVELSEIATPLSYENVIPTNRISHNPRRRPAFPRSRRCQGFRANSQEPQHGLSG